ncbi:GTP-binding protein [Saprospiraceae bacterium]|jgi:hypothetical protein|nr:GTP-binding protein [Saprospiraceae bacterium]
MAFIENQDLIEQGWHAQYGDRKNEIVIIGQDLNEALITKELESCIATEDELNIRDWKQGFEDEWPMEMAFVIE